MAGGTALPGERSASLVRAPLLVAVGTVVAATSCTCGGLSDSLFIRVRSDLLPTAPSVDADCEENQRIASSVVDLERATRFVARLEIEVPTPLGEYGGPLQEFRASSVTIFVTDPARVISTALGDTAAPIPGTPSVDQPRVLTVDEIEQQVVHGVPHLTFTALSESDLAAIALYFADTATDASEARVAILARVEGTIGYGLPGRTNAHAILVSICRDCLAPQPACAPGEVERTQPCFFQGQNAPMECATTGE